MAISARPPLPVASEESRSNDEKELEAVEPRAEGEDDDQARPSAGECSRVCTRSAVPWSRGKIWAAGSLLWTARMKQLFWIHVYQFSRTGKKGLVSCDFTSLSQTL
jgi:hypothetical protein